MGAAGDRGEAVGAVPGGVQPGHHRQQHLGGADVGGGLLPADVLFPGLQRESQRPPALGVDRHPDQTAREGTLHRLADGHEPRVRAAVAQGHPEALRRSDHDVGAPRTGGLEEGERQEIRGDAHHGSCVAGGGDDVAVVHHGPRGTGVGEEQAEALVAGEVDRRVAHHHLDPEGLGAGGHHLLHLGVAVVVHEEGLAPHLRMTTGQGHGLGRGGGLVEERRVGDVHPGEVGDDRLEVQQRLEATLADLRLVRRVGGVPAGVLEHVAEDHVRHDRVRVTAADQTGEHGVPGRDLPESVQRVGLRRNGGEPQRLGVEDGGRQGGGGQRVEARLPHHGEHPLHLGRVGAEVAVEEVATEGRQRDVGGRIGQRGSRWRAGGRVRCPQLSR